MPVSDHRITSEKTILRACRPGCAGYGEKAEGRRGESLGALDHRPQLERGRQHDRGSRGYLELSPHGVEQVLEGARVGGPDHQNVRVVAGDRVTRLDEGELGNEGDQIGRRFGAQGQADERGDRAAGPLEIDVGAVATDYPRALELANPVVDR